MKLSRVTRPGTTGEKDRRERPRERWTRVATVPAPRVDIIGIVIERGEGGVDVVAVTVRAKESVTLLEGAVGLLQTDAGTGMSV